MIVIAAIPLLLLCLLIVPLTGWPFALLTFYALLFALSALIFLAAGCVS